ncbi:glutamine amidotransferases class-II family protein, partial [Mycobacterium kansasii 732]
LVSQVFDEQTLAAMQGHVAIGHCRYSTTGDTTWENAQPVFRNTAAGPGSPWDTTGTWSIPPPLPPAPAKRD